MSDAKPLNLAGLLRELFTALTMAGYEWQPQTPDRLLQFRKEPEGFRPLVRFFGLGLEVSGEDLAADGLSRGLFENLRSSGLSGRLAVAGSGGAYVVHDHWPPKNEMAAEYVHCGEESTLLLTEISPHLPRFSKMQVLDLGCSSGILTFPLVEMGARVLGLDVCNKAVLWARATAVARAVSSARFESFPVGSPEASELARETDWDFAVFNPPMVVPSSEAAYPHRDGGKLGIEIPLLFLEFAREHLKPGGEIFCLTTNPILAGKSELGEFFDRLEDLPFEILGKKRLHTHFNQNVARKQGYPEQGIQRVELWQLHLKNLFSN